MINVVTISLKTISFSHGLNGPRQIVVAEHQHLVAMQPIGVCDPLEVLFEDGRPSDVAALLPFPPSRAVFSTKYSGWATSDGW